jgi:hypothetical protein
LSADKRSNAIFVAGGGPFLCPIPGSAYLYDAETGAELAENSFNGLFVNDVVVTRDAAYFTDSARPVRYRVPLESSGELPDPLEIRKIPLGGGFNFDSAVFPNADGIDASPNGEWLILVNIAFHSLYKLNPSTGEAFKIDLGGVDVPNGNGLVLLNQIGILIPDTSLTSGVVIKELLISDEFHIPTKAARFGNSIYAVNARFGHFTPGVPTPDLEFTVVGLHLR